MTTAYAGKTAVERFGEVHLLFNNAGVGVAGPRVWERTLEDWHWVLGVNLWGVIHGIHAFLPIMMRQSSDLAHIVNTASAAGLMAPPGMAPYTVSKHGVVSLTEVLHHELVREGSHVRTSVFCPGLVKTRIVDAARNRPGALGNPSEFEQQRSARYADAAANMRAATEAGSEPSEMAAAIYEGIDAGEFYILPHDWVRRGAGQRLGDIVQGRPPTDPSA